MFKAIPLEKYYFSTSKYFMTYLSFFHCLYIHVYIYLYIYIYSACIIFHVFYLKTCFIYYVDYCSFMFMMPFYTPVSRRAVLCDWVWQAAGRAHKFPHNNFSSVHRIFTKLGQMIPLWKGKNPIYFGVIRLKVKVTINRMFNNRVVSA